MLSRETSEISESRPLGSRGEFPTLAVVLLVTSALWLQTTLGDQPFSAATSLPFALCDVAALVAAAALFTRQRLLVELTYFLGPLRPAAFSRC